jgi:hypothetical protein
MKECHVIPSLDLVVAQTGNGQPEWDVRVMIEQVVDASTREAAAAAPGASR